MTEDVYKHRFKVLNNDKTIYVVSDWRNERAGKRMKLLLMRYFKWAFVPDSCYNLSISIRIKDEISYNTSRPQDLPMSDYYGNYYDGIW